MKPICIIPARGGSKGVLNKNIRLIGGKPLIAHTLISSLNSDIFSHVFVSTEDKKIASIAKKYVAEVPFMRPKRFSHSRSPTIETVRHTLKFLQIQAYDSFSKI